MLMREVSVREEMMMPRQEMLLLIYLFVENCQETSTRDTANKRSRELCAPIVLVLLEDGCGKLCFLPGQVVSNCYL
jgi:hypothetical protein